MTAQATTPLLHWDEWAMPPRPDKPGWIFTQGRIAQTILSDLDPEDRAVLQEILDPDTAGMLPPTGRIWSRLTETWREITGPDRARLETVLREFVPDRVPFYYNDWYLWYSEDDHVYCARRTYWESNKTLQGVTAASLAEKIQLYYMELARQVRAGQGDL